MLDCACACPEPSNSENTDSPPYSMASHHPPNLVVFLLAPLLNVIEQRASFRPFGVAVFKPSFFRMWMSSESRPLLVVAFASYFSCSVLRTNGEATTVISDRTM